jgi:signal transduction histidine kinase
VTPVAPAAALLALRAGLFLAAAATDGSGLGRALFVLIPFGAYFVFGRTVSIALGVGCVVLVVVIYQVTAPRWYADPEHVSDLLMFGAGLVLTIAMAAVAVEERAGRVQLEVYAARVAELSTTAERLRLARDIHDGLGHGLTAVAVLLERADAFRERDPEAAWQAVRDAQACTRQALDDVRHSVRTLRANTGPFQLSAALADLVRDGHAGGPPVSLKVSGDENGYGEPALTALYRAAQEGITNARRHARASRIQVSLDLDPAAARLVVADDGCGFAPDRTGFGLLGMRERVGLVHGRVDVDSAPGTGTRLAVTIPRSLQGTA